MHGGRPVQYICVGGGHVTFLRDRSRTVAPPISQEIGGVMVLWPAVLQRHAADPLEKGPGEASRPDCCTAVQIMVRSFYTAVPCIFMLMEGARWAPWATRMLKKDHAGDA